MVVENSGILLIVVFQRLLPFYLFSEFLSWLYFELLYALVIYGCILHGHATLLNSRYSWLINFTSRSHLIAWSCSVVELWVSMLFVVQPFQLNRNSLTSVMCLDWRMYGVKMPLNWRDSIFSKTQTLLSLHYFHIPQVSLVREKIKRDLVMRQIPIGTHLGEVLPMDRNGLIFFLALMSCEYLEELNNLLLSFFINVFHISISSILSYFSF